MKTSRNFSDGLARLVPNGKYGFVDPAGEAVIPFTYEDAGDFTDGLACDPRSLFPRRPRIRRRLRPGRSPYQQPMLSRSLQVFRGVHQQSGPRILRRALNALTH